MGSGNESQRRKGALGVLEKERQGKGPGECVCVGGCAKGVPAP